MAFGDYILERLGDAAYTPGVNPAVKMYDPKALTYHDAQGNPVPLYKQPNLVQRLLSPTADEFAKLNAQEQASPLEAEKNEAIQKQIYENRDRPALQTFFGNRYIPHQKLR